MSDDLNAVRESAKAIQEAAKTAGQAIEASRGVGSWLDRMFGRAIENTVGRYWTDPMMARRLEAAILNREMLLRLVDNAEKRLRTDGIDTRRIVPPKIMIPLLEGATMEHEDDLHELWENLLATAVNPNKEEVKRAYVSILGELGGKDAHTLRTFYAEWRYYNERDQPEPENSKSRYSSGVGVAPIDYECAILFNRLGLIMPVHVAVEEYSGQRPVTENT